MTRMLVDNDLFKKLDGLPGPIEMCDENGNTLGYFSPVHANSKHFDYGITDDEIHRREQLRTGRPIDEVIADLERR